MGKPKRTFAGYIGLPSTGAAGPDPLRDDLDNLFAALDPNDKFKDGTPGGITTENIRDNSITDDKIGQRTVDQNISVLESNTGTITQLLSWIVKHIKAIKGAVNNWYDGAVATISDIWAKFDSSTGHKHTGSLNDAPQIDSTGIADGAVTTAKISNGAVTTDKIADGAVTTAKISNRAVTTDKIADLSITDIKIANGTISGSKIAALNITSGHLADSSVTTDKINNLAVTTSKIAIGAVTTDRISTGAVTTEKISDGAVTTSKIADKSITSPKIADGNVTTIHLADGAVTATKLDPALLSQVGINQHRLVTPIDHPDSSVTTSKIADGAVTTSKIADSAVTKEKLNIVPADIGAVANAGSTPSIQAGVDSSKPAAGTAGRIYIATDTFKIYRDNGTSWDVVGTVNWGDITGKPASFTPSAHKSTHATGGSDPLTPADIGAVNKAGDTMTGLLAFNVALPSGVNTSDTPDKWPASGFAEYSVSPGTLQNQPSHYGKLLHFAHGNVKHQLFMQWIHPQGGASGNLWYRHAGEGDTAWGQWHTVWHAGNDGAGSGLDADMVDGVHVTGSGSTGLRKITTSTAAPSGGSDGDIWIQYA